MRTVQNVGLDVGLDKTEKAVFGLFIENSDITAEEMSAEAIVKEIRENSQAVIEGFFKTKPIV